MTLWSVYCIMKNVNLYSFRLVNLLYYKTFITDIHHGLMHNEIPVNLVYNIVCSYLSLMNLLHDKTAITDSPVLIYTVACISPPCL